MALRGVRLPNGAAGASAVLQEARQSEPAAPECASTVRPPPASGQRELRRPYLGQSKSAIAGPPSVRHGRACGTATTWYQGLPAVLVGQVREAPKGSTPRLRTARRQPWQRRERRWHRAPAAGELCTRLQHKTGADLLSVSRATPAREFSIGSLLLLPLSIRRAICSPERAEATTSALPPSTRCTMTSTTPTHAMILWRPPRPACYLRPPPTAPLAAPCAASSSTQVRRTPKPRATLSPPRSLQRLVWLAAQTVT